MRPIIIIGALILAVGMVSARAGVTLQLSSEVMREINLTPDSSRGWIPTAEQRQMAVQAAEAFLDALESGRYAEAYGLQTEINKRNQSLAQFTADAEKFRSLAGPVRFWKVLKITWTKDPAHAPSTGIYAAIDLAAVFANVDRDCGYMVIYQPPVGGSFTIIRRENNYIDNATARTIEAQKSKAELAQIWGQMSRYCPNYIPPN
jgi:hypothetical protein